MRSCAAWSANSSSAAFASTGPNQELGSAKIPADRALTMREAGHPARSIRIYLSMRSVTCDNLRSPHPLWLPCCAESVGSMLTFLWAHPGTGRAGNTGHTITTCAVPDRNGEKSTCSNRADLLRHRKSGRPAQPLRPLVTPGGKPSPQAIVAFEGFADRRRLGWSASMAAAKTRLRRSSSIRARYCRKIEEENSFGCRMAAHSSALVRRKKPKSGLSSCSGQACRSRLRWP